MLNRVNDQVETLTRLNHQASQARDMIYEVTAQSHYRAMALLKLDDPTWTPKIYAAKDEFAKNMAEMRTYAVPSELGLLDHVESTNEVYAESSQAVTDLFEAGKVDQALQLHIEQEHEVSHVLEAQLNELITDSQALVTQETDDFAENRRFLTIAVGVFSGVSLLIALTLGAILSWSLIRPVRRVDAALEQIAGGDFNTHVEVPNRDEFGNLTRNLNRTTDQLSALYQRLHDLNANLQETVETKVAELERTSRLRRYLSPQLADSIVSGEQDVALEPSRKYLTTFFSDVRGFTAAAERMDPGQLVHEMNDYFSAMTEIVFKHGGTLDKYVGDAVMVFFGDPIPQEDHAARAVRMGDRDARAHEDAVRPLAAAVRRGVRDRDRHLDGVGHRGRPGLTGAERLHRPGRPGERGVAARRPGGGSPDPGHRGDDDGRRGHRRGPVGRRGQAQGHHPPGEGLRTDRPVREGAQRNGHPRWPNAVRCRPSRRPS